MHGLSICSSVCLSVCLSPNCKNEIFSKTKQFRAMVSIVDLWSRTSAYQRTHYWSLKYKMAEIRHLENRHDVIFFCRGWSDLDKISQTGAEWHVDCGDVVTLETRCRILMWWTFGRIPCHVIPEPRITLQGAVTWRNQCHDLATLQGVITPSVILKILFAIFFFCFLVQFGLWRIDNALSLSQTEPIFKCFSEVRFHRREIMRMYY